MPPIDVNRVDEEAVDGADLAPHIVDPRGMVDQFFEYGATLEAVVLISTAYLARMVARTTVTDMVLRRWQPLLAHSGRSRTRAAPGDGDGSTGGVPGGGGK